MEEATLQTSAMAKLTIESDMDIDEEVLLFTNKRSAAIPLIWPSNANSLLGVSFVCTLWLCTHVTLNSAPASLTRSTTHCLNQICLQMLDLTMSWPLPISPDWSCAGSWPWWSWSCKQGSLSLRINPSEVQQSYRASQQACGCCFWVPQGTRCGLCRELGQSAAAVYQFGTGMCSDWEHNCR